MFLLEPSNPNAVGPEQCSIAEAQDKVFKIAFRTRSEFLKKEINKTVKGICEHTNSKME